MKVIYGNTIAETGVWIRPHAFMKHQKNGYMEVYFRTNFICKYPVNDVIKSNKTNVILNDDAKTEFYIKDAKVFSYSHVHGNTELVLDNVEYSYL